MATGKELRKALKVNDLTMEQAAEKMGLSRQSIYNLVKKPELDADTVRNVKEKLGIDLDAPAIPYIEQRREQKLEDEPYMVPFVDIPAQAGYVSSYMLTDYDAKLTKYPLLPGVDPTGGVWKYFVVSGKSMEPVFEQGDVLLCSLVMREDWKRFDQYHTYVVITQDSLVVKDVYRYDESRWMLLSQNKDYPPQLVSIKDVKQLWVMRRHTKNRARKHRFYDLEEIKRELGLDKEERPSA